MKDTLGILAAGELGKQIAHYAIRDGHYKNVVFFDDVTQEKEIAGYPVIGTKADIISKYQEGAFQELILALGYKHLNIKQAIYEEFSGLIPFGKIIHSSSWVDPTAVIEPGCVIYPCCAIDAQAKIQANTILNVACTIAHDSVIGKHSFLSPRVAIAGFVKVADRCIIGINSTIIDNIHISESTQIGGGTVIIKSIEQSGLYVGNPARFIR